MSAENRKVLLLIDNCPAHSKTERHLLSQNFSILPQILLANCNLVISDSKPESACGRVVGKEVQGFVDEGGMACGSMIIMM